VPAQNSKKFSKCSVSGTAVILSSALHRQTDPMAGWTFEQGQAIAQTAL